MGIESGKPSLYGWVESNTSNIDYDEILNKINSSSTGELIAQNNEELEAQIRFTFESIKNQKTGTTVVTDSIKKKFYGQNDNTKNS